jgi:cytoskeletal protein CcmA (bactofilin family)
MWKKSDSELNMTFPDKNTTATREPSNNAIIGKTLIVTGEVNGNEDLLIEGNVDGTIRLDSHTVTVGGSGTVNGDIYAKVIHIQGTLNGDVFGGEQVIVHDCGNVRGNITAPRVALEDGAKLRGSIDMDPKTDEQASKDSDDSTETGYDDALTNNRPSVFGESFN